MCKVSANKDYEKIADLGKMYNYIMSCYNKFQKETLSVIKWMYWQQYMLLVSSSFNIMTFNASITLFWRSAVRVSSLCVMIWLLYFDLYMSYAQWKVFVMWVPYRSSMLYFDTTQDEERNLKSYIMCRTKLALTGDPETLSE